MQCTAKSKRTHKQCNGKAVRGTDKCRMHGGKSGTLKTGLHSKYPARRPDSPYNPSIKQYIADIDADPRKMSAESQVKALYATGQRILDELDQYLRDKPDNMLINLDKLQTASMVLFQAVKGATALEELAIKRQDQARRLLFLFWQAISRELEAKYPHQYQGIMTIFLKDRQFDKAEIAAVDVDFQIEDKSNIIK